MNVTRFALALGLSLVTVVGIAGQGRNAQLVILDATVDVGAAGSTALYCPRPFSRRKP